MLLPVEWLRDFIDIKESVDELAHILTMVGLEIEGMESPGSDPVFEVNITPNRPDCLSVIGVARELSAATGRELKLQTSSVKDDFETDFRVTIDSPLCSRYTGRIIKGVRISESPGWLKKRLELSGIRSINNIVDITNYVMLESGHPLHAFDLDTLKGNTIRVDTPEKTIHFSTLDGIERKIPGDSLLIWDAERPIAIAGIMGGDDTEVTGDTINIFLESAYFTPRSIRRTSRNLGLQTESSYRFERGADIEGLSLALDRAAILIKELCGGKLSNKIDIYPERYIPAEIRLRFSRIKRLLGIEVPGEEVIKIMELLGFAVVTSTDTDITIRVPSFRVDIKNEADLVEEVGRHFGYEKIPAHIPSAPVAGSRRRTVINLIRDVMKSSGFNEAINYSFMNPDMLDRLDIPEDDERRKTVGLINPIRSQDSSLRTTLLPSLIDNLVYNLNQGIRDIKLFEISKVFINRKDVLPEERTMLGGVYMYSKGQYLWEDKEDVFYILKGTIEKMFYSLYLKQPLFRRSTETFLHPGKSSDIFINDLGDRKIGYIGILSPGIRNRLGLKHLKNDIGLFGLNLDSVLKDHTVDIQFRPLPRFPYIQRDIALLIDDSVTSEEILSLIKNFPSELIEDTWIFDHYKGKNLPDNKTSLGFSIIYRSMEKTLTDQEVEPVHQRLLEYLLERTGGELRS
jgi:phenylalanyl-tRNA synthetase beta chain